MNVFVYSKRVSGAVESASMIHTMPPSGPNEICSNAITIEWQSASKRANQSLQAAKHQKVILFTNS
jgi:hypothetical protein